MFAELYLKYLNEQRQATLIEFKKNLEAKRFIFYGEDLMWHLTGEGLTFLNQEVVENLNKEYDPITNIDPRGMGDVIRGLLNDKYIDYRIGTDELHYYITHKGFKYMKNEINLDR
jgi:predicted transcriptional regulator